MIPVTKRETTWSQINTSLTTESTCETAERTLGSERWSGVCSRRKQRWLCINTNEVLCQPIVVCCVVKWHFYKLASFPVDMTATMGNFWTSTSVTPTVARRPISDGPMWVPFASTHSPRLMSWPIGLETEREREREREDGWRMHRAVNVCMFPAVYCEI